jgi:heme exporter protein B
MCCFECLLLPVFSVLAGLPLPAPLVALTLVALLANAGFAAIGAFLGAVTSSLQERGFLLVLLQLPLVVPIALGASEATRLLMMEQTGVEWWRWIQLLTVFAVIYLAAGLLLFEFVTEE